MNHDQQLLNQLDHFIGDAALTETDAYSRLSDMIYSRLFETYADELPEDFVSSANAMLC